MELQARLAIDDIIRSPNIAEKLSDGDLHTIALHCKQGFDDDLRSRADWDARYSAAMKLALQLVEKKNFPWPNCANVKFPLITVAALNFHAKAYSALINGSEVIRYRVSGEDVDGMKAKRAERLTNHGNEQLLERTGWEDDTDKALLVTPIMGCTFKKTYYDPDVRTVVSRLVLPQYFVVPYYTSDLDTCPRSSEIFELSYNSFLSRIRRGRYLNQDYVLNYTQLGTDMEATKREAQGVTPTFLPVGQPVGLIEQHCLLDLDGDGYSEPYVVTFIRDSGQICRIVARFDKSDIEKNKKGEIAYISPEQYYTKMPFIPSPDGGFYDIGLGMLLGQLNHAVDTLINQLLDAGTMHLLGGGFLGRGVKIRKGESTFSPLEWKSVDSTGASLKDNIVPLPTRDVPPTLLELLVFLVQWGERIGEANNVQQGEIPGQNTKAEVYRLANANGQKVFAAIYKRWWRSSKREFQKWYICASRAIKFEQATVLALGNIEPEDYSLPFEGIFPAADPNIVSKEQQRETAVMVFNTSQLIGGHNVYEVTKRMYRAFDVANIEEVFPDPKGKNAIPASPSPELLAAQAKLMAAETARLKVQNDQQLAIAELFAEVDERRARITKLNAEALALEKQAANADRNSAIALLNAEIGAEKNKIDGVLKAMQLLKDITKNDQSSESGKSGDVGGGGMASLEKPASDGKVLRLPSPQATGGNGSVGV